MNNNSNKSKNIQKWWKMIKKLNDKWWKIIFKNFSLIIDECVKNEKKKNWILQTKQSELSNLLFELTN